MSRVSAFKGYNPELPVFMSADSNILVVHLPHLVAPLSGDRCAGGRQHSLAVTAIREQRLKT